MRMSAVAGAALGLMTVLAAGVPTRAQDTDRPEPAKAVAPELEGGAERETLRELQARRKKARGEVQLLEAQLSVKRAEAQKIDAELQVFLVQHPNVGVDEEALEAAIRRDPEIASLMPQVESARARLEILARMTRYPGDPARAAAERRLRSLEGELRELASSRRSILLQRGSIRSSSEPRTAGDPDEVERRLDVIIAELEGVKRALLREPQKP